jgi:Flp pilus assembly protein TadG
VLVEAALVFPLLLLLTLGLLEYGWMFLHAQRITNAARHGARLGVLPDATNAEVEAAIAALMDAGGMAGSGYTVTFSPADVAFPAPGEALTVTINVLYENVDLGMPLLPLPTNLEASVSMAKEGP